jgi:hypothetical protein
MRSAGALAISAICGACRGDSPPVRPPPVGSGSVATPVPTPGKVTCTDLPFAASTPLPEASGAAWLAIAGKLGLVVISDSGNDGAYVVLDPETGDVREQGKLPLGGGTDDLEGLAVRDGKLYAVSSPGWIRVWALSGHELTLVDGPYPLGPVDLPDKKRAEPGSPGMVCSERKTNCGRDYEGLCLAPKPTTDCLGFAASKTDGTLYCVVDKEGKLAVDPTRGIHIAKSGVVADCAFSETGELVVGSNLLDASHVYRVTNWADPAHAAVEELGSLGIGFPETIAIRGDVIYRMSDTGGAPSLMTKYRCK